jgi:hypothetical protein
VTARRLFVCSALLLFANAAYGGGTFQRTKDGQTFVWNNAPRSGDQATWSGKRDAQGYATGYGTLTWYSKAKRTVVTGSNIPSAQGRSVVVSRYSGKMVRGKLDGPVVNVDANGKTFRGTFVNGTKASDWGTGPTPVPDQRRTGSDSGGAAVEAPAEGPAPAPAQRPTESVSDGAAIKATTEDSDFLQAVTPPSRLLTPTVAAASPQASISSTPVSPSPSPAAIDPAVAVKNRIIADFKEQTQSVLSRVGDATGNFHQVDRLDSVQKLPAPVSESVDSLVDRARDFRSKVGYETALQECRTETEIVDALAVVDQITRNIAANDASEANARLTDFLKNTPEPIADSQKALWRYLTAMRSLCSRLEKDADIHLQRAQSLASASRTSDAIREYQEAYRTFPNPNTAEKIRQLQDNSLGL